MKNSLLLTAAWIALFAMFPVPLWAQTESAGCGEHYPAGFPCIANGKVLESPRRNLPVIGTINALAYGMPYADLYAALMEAAKNAGWTVVAETTGDEPDGNRYRVEFSRNLHCVGVSVYKSGRLAILQVMETNEGACSPGTLR